MLKDSLGVIKNTLYKHRILILSFLFGQVLVQLINLVSGYFILRWLSVEEYSRYTLALAFQATAQRFVEFGFSGAIIAMVGKNVADKNVVGAYIVAGTFYRLRTFLIVSFATLIAFPFFAIKQHWETYEIVGAICVILLNLYFVGRISYFKPVLQIHKRIHGIYKVENSIAAFKLASYSLLHVLNAFTGLVALFINCIQTYITGTWIKKNALPYVEGLDLKPEEEKKREMLNYILPIMPGVIFSAFQSQLALFIISYFGSPSSLADLGALSRIGQMFLVFNTGAALLVTPYIAKKDEGSLKKLFLTIFVGALILCLGIIISSIFLIDIFKWFLGEKYQHLDKEIILTITNACIIFINTLFWNMNCSRKWLFKWMPLISIPGTLCVQVLLGFSLDLSVVQNVILFNIGTSLFILATRLNVSFWGLKKI